MYAISDPLRDSWSALYDALSPALEQRFGATNQLKFETSDDVLSSEQLLLGQTCGYPLVTRYRSILQPVSVAEFDVTGCEAAKYSSAIVVSVDSDIRSLVDARGKAVIINSCDSNSGMNMLRAKLDNVRHEGKPFFSQTLLSGSHKKSVEAVAHQAADVASIDCVTLAYLQEAAPELVSKVRVIEYTERSTGLPIVTPIHRAESLNPSYVTELLNTGLDKLDEQYRIRLRIKRFSEPARDAYSRIAQIDAAARQAGHKPELL